MIGKECNGTSEHMAGAVGDEGTSIAPAAENKWV